MMIEIGSILELRLTKKIKEHGLLIFNINNNVSARLHIRNISNDPTLSKKMFDLFEIGNEVTVLVIGFNKEKNYYELSTNAFRNSLDNVLPFLECRDIIKREYQDYSQLGERHLKRYRNILNRLRGDLASEGLTFLYELLQNAVDHPNNNFKNELSVHFEIFNDYLLLKHNGALFTENNFKSICGILDEEELKETDFNRIGYKGIGFKLVFRHTNNVYIRSGNFSFCFKKGIDGESIPWEVMPIFQNEIAKIDEIPQFDFFNSPVAFAFEFSSEEQKDKVIQYLTELAKNPYLIIIPEKLKKLKITTSQNEYVFEKEIVKDAVGRNVIRLIIDGSICSDWFIFSNTFLIEDQRIINELTDDNNKSVPVQFKQFRTPKIDIIIPCNKLENPVNLFYYLPLSATRYQLDYIVNGDFIPNLDRSNIIENLLYNLKLAEFAGLQVLKTCESFANNSEFKKIKLLFPNFETGNNLFKDKLQASFLERAKDSEIFPSYYDGELTSFSNTLIDNSELYLLLPKNQYNALTNTIGNPLNPASDLQSEYLFLCNKYEQGTIFTIDDWKVTFKKPLFQEWLQASAENNLKFWKFIFNKWTDIHENKDVIQSLKELPVLCKSINEPLFHRISESYLSSEYTGSDEIEKMLSELDEPSSLISGLYISENDDIKKWSDIFEKLGAITDLQNVIQKMITKLEAFDESKYFKITSELFKFWKKRHKTQNPVFDSLQLTELKNNIKLKCNNGFKKANECVIGDFYNDEDKIKSILPEIELDNEISPEYQSIEADKSLLKTFFKEVLQINSLIEKQAIFNAKLDSYIQNQDRLQDSHFSILKEISDLYKDRQLNNLKFEFEASLSKIKLKTNDGQWLLPNQIFFTSIYNPKLDLQKDKTKNDEFKLLSEQYIPYIVDFEFLKKLGIADNFVFNRFEFTPYNDFENQNIKTFLFDGELFKTRKSYLLTRYTLEAIKSCSKFKNHVNCQPPSLGVIQNNNQLFFQELNKLSIEYFGKTELINNGSIYGNCDNELISFIKENETIKTKAGTFSNPRDLYSLKLEKFINDKSLLPEPDLLHKPYKSEKNVEELIGITQELSPSLCINILERNSLDKISLQEIKDLSIVEILENYSATPEECNNVFLYNQIEEWKPAIQLFTAENSDFELDSSYLLHIDLLKLQNCFGIKCVSKEDIVFKITPENPASTDEIGMSFRNKAKFIAFKIDQSNYEQIESEINEKTSLFSFYEVSSIVKVFPEINPIFKEEIDFHFAENERKIYYTGNWKFNSRLTDWILNELFNNQFEKQFLQNVFSKSDAEIEQELKKLPWLKEINDEGANNVYIKDKPKDITQFKKDIKFDIDDLVNSYPQEIIGKIEQLILGISDSTTESYKVALNDLVKLKFLKKNNIAYNPDLFLSNRIIVGDKIHVFHSARGALAYIKLSEINDVKNGANMVIDFGKGLDNLIEYSFEELLGLNFHHIYYQANNGNIEEVFEFVEKNICNDNIRMLLVDPNRKIAKTLNLIEQNSKENIESEIDHEASELL